MNLTIRAHANGCSSRPARVLPAARHPQQGPALVVAAAGSFLGLSLHGGRIVRAAEIPTHHQFGSVFPHINRSGVAA